MKIHHSPYHWISVLAVLVALLLTVSEAYGQNTGAQAGPPQGGLGNVVSAREDAKPARDDVKPARDQSIAKEQRSSTKKAKRAAKRTAERSRHGISPIDSSINVLAR